MEENKRENTKTVVLHDGKEVKMRRPKARDIINASGVSTNPAQQEASIIADICMMTISEVEDLDADDFMTLAGARNSFL